MRVRVDKLHGRYVAEIEGATCLGEGETRQEALMDLMRTCKVMLKFIEELIDEENT